MACKGTPVLALLLLCLSCGRGIGPAEKGLAAHTAWLLNRMVPNAVLPTPLPSRQNLGLSYAVAPGDPGYPFLYSKSFIYDDALLAVALSASGEWERAADLLLSVSTLINPDGGLWFNYNLAVDWPSDKDPSFALVRTGTVAWMGYAYCYFLENHPSLPPNDRLRDLFLGAARKLAGYMEKMAVKDPASPLCGLVRGGSNTTSLKVKPTGEIEEIWEALPVDWASTEHNIDAHLFLSHLAALTHETRYYALADTLSRTLVRTLWSDRDRQFVRGIKGNGTLDTVLALDCASWAAVFLTNTGRDSLARLALASAESRYRNSYKEAEGYRPYAGILVYESPEINRHFFSDRPDLNWDDLPFIWLEGNYGVLLGRMALGDRKSARNAVNAWSLFFERDSSGGLPYTFSERELPYQFSAWKSVASTAWHVILTRMLFEKPLPRPFFSKAE